MSGHFPAIDNAYDDVYDIWGIHWLFHYHFLEWKLGYAWKIASIVRRGYQWAVSNKAKATIRQRCGLLKNAYVYFVVMIPMTVTVMTIPASRLWNQLQLPDSRMCP